MRAAVFILILLVVAVIAAVATGYVDITNIRGQPPAVIATRNSVSVKGGQAPSFDVEAGSVKIGTRDTTVKVPTSVQIRKPMQNEAAAATNNAM